MKSRWHRCITKFHISMIDQQMGNTFMFSSNIWHVAVWVLTNLFSPADLQSHLIDEIHVQKVNFLFVQTKFLIMEFLYGPIAVLPHRPVRHELSRNSHIKIFTNLQKFSNMPCDGLAAGMFIMMSWYGNVSRVTGPFWGESIGHQWIPLTMGQ